MTLFDDIYTLNQTIMNDSRLSRLGDNDFYLVLYNYLVFSISLFRNWCSKNLSKMTKFSQQKYSFTGLGDETDFVLNPIPPINAELYISIDDVAVSETDYSYNPTTATIRFDIEPSSDCAIFVSAYIKGSFDEDLDSQELVILAEGMTVPFSEGSLLKSKQLSQAISSEYSQGNHNKVLLEIVNQRYSHLGRLISDYGISDGVSGWGGASTNA